MTTILNCEHEKQEMVMNRKIHERPYVRRPRQTLKLQRNPRAVRVCPSSTLSVPPALGAVWGCAPGPGGGLGKCPQRWGLPGGVPPAMGVSGEVPPVLEAARGFAPGPVGGLWAWESAPSPEGGLGKFPQSWRQPGDLPSALLEAYGSAPSPRGGLGKCLQPWSWPVEVRGRPGGTPPGCPHHFKTKKYNECSHWGLNPERTQSNNYFLEINDYY